MSKLANIKKTALQSAQRFCFYGPEAVGKTTLAAHAPEPIFFDCEGGSNRLVVARYPFRDEDGGHIPKSYTEVLDGIANLLAADHPYQTLVIDTVDALEALLHAFVIDRDLQPGGALAGKNAVKRAGATLESYGYGKGYVVADGEWQVLLTRLDELRIRRKMHIILLAHTQVKRFANPDGEDWDRFQLRLQDGDRVSAARRVKEWADVVGFCTFHQGAAREGDERKAKGYSSGKRLVKFERSHAYDAKTRIPLPQELELSNDDPWTPIGEAIEVGTNMSADAVVALMQAELARIGDPELNVKVETAIKAAHGNVATLGRYLNSLKNKETKTEQPTS